MNFKMKDDKAIFEKVCKHCGCLDSGKYPGKGPHLAELKCTGCNRHNGWLSRYDVVIAELYEDGLFAPDTVAEKIIEAQDEIDAAAYTNDKYKEQSLRTYREKMLALLAAMPGVVDARHWLNLARNDKAASR